MKQTWCQFLINSLFCTKACFEQLFFTYSLALNFFGEKYLHKSCSPNVGEIDTFLLWKEPTRVFSTHVVFTDNVKTLTP